MVYVSLDIVNYVHSSKLPSQILYFCKICHDQSTIGNWSDSLENTIYRMEVPVTQPVELCGFFHGWERMDLIVYLYRICKDRKLILYIL